VNAVTVRLQPENLNPVVDLFLELVFLDEAVDLHDAEEVADAFADAAFIQATPVSPALASF
jgi:hypothetical protein